AHRRLSIIDLSDAATQPMANSDQSVVIVFNGEIYNHAEIRKELESLGKYQWKTDHSDTEVILHAYQEWGLACVHRFYGMFAIAIYDRRDKDHPVLHLIRDRVGIKPLYFARTAKGEWLFASEIRALFPHPDISSEMDPVAFWHYLTFIITPAPLTLFKGIFKIPAGHTISINHRGDATFNQYWDCRPDPENSLSESDISESEAADELLRLLKKAVERRMVSDVPFGVLLSGGVDSGMNVALMSELMERPVKSFTIGYEGEEETNEFQWARRVSERYQTDHHESLINQRDAQNFLPLLVELQDEPIADNVCIPLYFLSKLVKDSGTTVVQVGEGADENWLGYWWVDHYRNKQETVYNPVLRAGQTPRWRKLLSRGKSRLPGFSGEDLEIQKRAEAGQELFWGGSVCWWGSLRDKLTPDPAPFQGEIDCPVPGLLPDAFRKLDSHSVVHEYLGPLNNRFNQPDSMRKIPYMEMKLRLPEHLLMRVDKLTMAHSIEARVPFLDHDVVNFATRCPPQYKLHDGIGKAVLKKAAEPYLEHDMIYRKKQGFGAPMESWFKDPEFGARALASFKRSRLVKDGFINATYFEDLLRAQMSGKAGGWSFHIWTVLNAMLWHESWVEGNRDCF
ncbi:MAG: asparagine synthase (glutamine-hydrolyzing), partial [Nitrospira sp.]|nr:asparagine synthase (glutamine-hydrolyzing) [Nitrospira sp.]